MDMYIVYIVFTLIQFVDNFVIDSEKSTAEKCAKILLLSNLEKDLLVISFNSSTLNVKFYHKNNFTTTIISDKNFISSDFWPYKTVFISARNNAELNTILTFLQQKQFLHTRAKHILKLDSNDRPEEIFKTTWDFNLMYVDLIFNKNSNIYTFFPYKNSNCGQKIIPEVIGSCNDKKIMTKNFSMNLKGCNVKMLTVPYIPYVLDYTKDRHDPKQAGIEITIMEAIAEKLNFSALYIQEYSDK